MSQATRHQIVLGGFLISCCWGTFGQAQDANELGQLATLQKKTAALTEAEQEVVAQWIRGQLTALSKEVTKPVTKEYPAKRKQQQVQQIRELVVRGAEGTSQYRSYYIKTLAALVVDRVDEQDPQVSVNDMIVLGGLADPSIADSYIQILNQGDVAIQFLALGALQAVRGKLPAQAFNTICPELVKFARDKADDILLERVYRFLDNPDNPTCRDALVELLAGRAAAYGEQAPSPRASDAVLAEACGRAAAQFQEAQRKQAVAALAGMLTTAASVDMEEKVDPATERRRALLERVIYSVEAALAVITGQNAGRPVTKALAQRNLAAAQTALVAWVGDAKTEGLLNRAPYGLQRLATSTKPAATKPASTEPAPGS